MDQRCRLQGVIGPFPLQIVSSQAAKFLVDESDQLVSGILIPGSPGVEQRRYVLSLRFHFCLDAPGNRDDSKTAAFASQSKWAEFHCFANEMKSQRSK